MQKHCQLEMKETRASTKSKEDSRGPEFWQEAG